MAHGPGTENSPIDCLGLERGAKNKQSGGVDPNLFQDPPCTLNWGYMVPNSRYLGPNRG